MSETHGGSVERAENGWRARLPRSLGRGRLGVYPTREEAEGVLRAAAAMLVERGAAPTSLATVGRRALEAMAESGDYRAIDRELDRWRAAEALRAIAGGDPRAMAMTIEVLEECVVREVSAAGNARREGSVKNG
jgi:hypothetical protein